MKRASLYEQVLDRLGSGGELPPPRPPRDSASVVLWRRRRGRLEVYWVRRSPNLAFMGGWHAFPGGGLARADARIDLPGVPQGLDEGPPDAGIPELLSGSLDLGEVAPPGLLACAVRELLEETGVLPAAAARAPGPRPDWLDRAADARRRLLAGEAAFSELAAELAGEIDLGLLTYAGRWLTPPFGPVRFDNRFFLLEWPAGAALEPSILEGELVEGEWVRPEDGLAAWRRGEVITAPPILHLLGVLAEEGPERGVVRMRNPVEANLGAHRRIEFRPGVMLFPMETPTLPPARHTNAYLLGHGESVLIDPGSPYPAEIAALRGALEALLAREGPDRVLRAIWLTHHHPDHVGGAAELREAFGVPVLAHALTAERLRGEVPVDAVLEDGQRVTLAGGPPMVVRVLHTPGHARGHLCFLDEGTGVLVSGDVISGLSTIVIDPPEGDMDVYLETLARLRDLAPSTLFPSHGPVLCRAADRFEETIAHRLAREARVAAAWAAGRRSPPEIVPAAYDDLDPLAVPLAERQVQAHLDRLRRRGGLIPS